MVVWKPTLCMFLLAGVVDCSAHDEPTAGQPAPTGSPDLPARGPLDAARGPDAAAHGKVAATPEELARRVCSLVSTGRTAELAASNPELGFNDEFRDPVHHMPGPPDVRVLATGKRGPAEQTQLARYAETLKAIASELASTPDPCTSLPELRSKTFSGTGWAWLPHARGRVVEDRSWGAAVYVGKSRSWGVAFFFHPSADGTLALRLVERWDAGPCPAHRHETPERCLGADVPDIDCVCVK